MPRQRGLVVAIALAFLVGGPDAHAEPSTEKTVDPYKIVNLEVEPLALLYGIYGVELDFRLSEKWSVGASYIWFDYISSGHISTAWQYGGSVTWFGLGRKPGGGGAFLRGSFQFLPVEVQDRTGLTGTRVVQNTSFGLVAGYQWMWPVGVNTNIGVGAIFHHSPATETVTLGDTTFDQPLTVVNEVQPLFEWTIGWAF